MKNKKLLVCIGSILVVLALESTCLADTGISEHTVSVFHDPPFWEGSVTLIRNSTIAVSAHTSSRIYRISGTTAMAALDKAAQHGGFEYTIDDTWFDQFGSLLVESIGGKQNEGLDGWQFWINYPHDDIPFTGADQTQVMEGDIVDFFYAGFGSTPDSSSMVIKIHVHLEEDTQPPTVSLIKPGEGYLYLADRELLRIPSQSTFVLGKITVQADAWDDHTEVTSVEFYVDQELRAEDTDPPYEWRWTDTVIGKYTLQAVAYDQNQNSNTVQISLYIISL